MSQQDSVKTITLELSDNEVNTILQQLGQGPFIQVAKLIHDIKSQAETQLKDRE